MFIWHLMTSHVRCIGEGNGNPLQCSCLENPRDGGAWWAAVYGVAQSRTRLKRLSISTSSSHVRGMVLSILYLLYDWILKDTTQGRQVQCLCPFYRPRNWGSQRSLNLGLIQGQSDSTACVLLLVMEPYCIYEPEIKTPKKGKLSLKTFHEFPLLTLPRPLISFKLREVGMIILSLLPLWNAKWFSHLPLVAWRSDGKLGLKMGILNLDLQCLGPVHHYIFAKGPGEDPGEGPGSTALESPRSPLEA